MTRQTRMLPLYDNNNHNCITYSYIDLHSYQASQNRERKKYASHETSLGNKNRILSKLTGILSMLMALVSAL